MASSLLKLEGLTKVFGTRPQAALHDLREGKSKAELLDTTGQVVGVHDVNLSIEQGELFVIMGLSGSGKSTLVRLINRLVEPTAGRVFLDGEDVTGMSKRQLVRLRRQKMSMVFQSFALLPHLSVIDNVAFGLVVAGVTRKEALRRAREALELVTIPEVAEHSPHQLSGGMRQRVGLARAWVTQSDIMLMDEAFSALDPMIRAEMQDALLNLQQSARRTIVFISHDLAEAARIADRIAVMKDGKICQVGTPVEIYRNPVDDYVEKFFWDIEPGRLLTAGDIAEPGSVASDVEPVSSSTLLEELIPRAAENSAPIPVTGEQGGIVGAVDRSGLLKALAKGGRG
ncbi:MAG: glycine betaine/L-proline ABC transporter ATP-binding protein [bacterium]